MAMTLVREAVSETTGVGSQFKVGLEKCTTSTFISSRRFSSPLAVVLFHFSDCSLSHSLSLSLVLSLSLFTNTPATMPFPLQTNYLSYLVPTTPWDTNNCQTSIIFEI